MIDDPTGHLDAKNVQWVKNWLGGFPGSTSANTHFLNEMCTHIVEFHERKLRQLKGEKGKVFQHFVEAYPEKASYLELTDKNEQCIFPVPGILEGVKSRGKTILKMQHVDFKYPTHEKNTVEDITLTVCMGSRVAVVGANGAGKSTAIKLLMGEAEADTGYHLETSKHAPGLRASAEPVAESGQAETEPEAEPESAKAVAGKLETAAEPGAESGQSETEPEAEPESAKEVSGKLETAAEPGAESGFPETEPEAEPGVTTVQLNGIIAHGRNQVETCTSMAMSRIASAGCVLRRLCTIQAPPYRSW